MRGYHPTKSLSVVYAQFSGRAKQVIADLEPIEDKEHLVVGLEKDKEVKPKEEAKKKGVKQALHKQP